MSRGLNKVTLIGNLGMDPEVRYKQSGDPITKISIATSEHWTDKHGEKQERTEWHRVVFFGKLAEIAGEYLTKGSQVYVEGKLRTSKYEKDGQDHYSTDIIADQMLMLGGGKDRDERPARGQSDRGTGGGYGGRRESAKETGQRARSAPAAAVPAGGYEEAFPDDDIPF